MSDACNHYATYALQAMLYMVIHPRTCLPPSCSLAVYGAICKELGTPLWYPGSDFGFQALTEVGWDQGRGC